MLTEYVSAAMRRAKYELMEDGDYFGTIPGFQGVWGSGDSLNDCQEDLRGALEGWLILKLWDHDDDIPILGKLSLYPREPKRKSRANASPVAARARKAS